MINNIKSLYADNFVKTSGLLFAAVFITNVSNYAFQILMGRLLTPSEYGLMNALLALFVIMAIPISTLLMVVAKKTAEYRAAGDFAGISGLFISTMSRVFLSGGIGLALFIYLSPSIRDYLHAPSIVPVVILGISIFIALGFPVNTAVLQGMQNYKWLAVTQGMVGPVKLVFCALFVLIGFSVNGVMGGLVLSSACSWYLSYIPIRKLKPLVSGHSSIVDHISFLQVVPVFISNLAFAVLTQADMVFVSRYFNAYDAGVYSSAAILGKAIMYVPSAIVLALFPMVSEHSAMNRSSRHLLIKSFLITMTISGAGALLLYLFPELIISILYGSQYHAAAEILKIYGIAMLPMALLMVLMNYLIAQGRSLFSGIMGCGALLEVGIISVWHNSQIILVASMFIIGTVLFVAGILLQALRPHLLRSSQTQ